MTRFEVSILPLAEAEIREAFHWYFERSPLAADAFRTEVIGAIDRLETDASMWPVDDDGLHYCHLRRFPFTIHYQLTAEKVTVIAVAHQRRRPGYWQAR